MALHIDVNDLLKKRKIESNCIEFKAGWNPDKIYHSICAFSNDRDNLGSGYILVGEVMDELRDLASRIPFDDRGNPDILLKDINIGRLP